MTNLHTLPMELVEQIASHLGYDDQVSLAKTHPDLLFMMPSEQVVDAPDFDPITWSLSPETYLDVTRPQPGSCRGQGVLPVDEQGIS